MTSVSDELLYRKTLVSPAASSMPFPNPKIALTIGARVTDESTVNWLRLPPNTASMGRTCVAEVPNV